MKYIMSSAAVSCILILCFASYVACFWSHKKLHHGQYDKKECKADAKEPWSYRGKNGPMYWGYSFPECNGNAQSPIDIDSHSVIPDKGLTKLSMVNYDIPISEATIENNGNTVEITPTDGVERTILVENSIYRLMQLHFHWGNAYYSGSEHTLDGKQYAMEMHLVHETTNGKIAVVAVLFQETANKNSEIQALVKHFPKVLYRDTQTELTSYLKLNNLLPANPSSYYRYTGSLTTPECTERVTWSVLTKPLQVGKKQMDEFRKLYSATKANASPKCKLFNNFRPVQPLNGRKVFRSK